jgi:hypothetical protein
MFTSIKHKALTASVFGLLSLGSLALSARPSKAASIDFTTWTSNIGDVTYTPASGSTPAEVVIRTGTGNLTTDKVALTGGGNGSLEAFLQNNNTNNIPAGSLDAVVPNAGFAGATQGSAIRNSVTVNANDIFRFSYTPVSANSEDNGFVTIGNTILPLSLTGGTSSTFTSPVFANAGTFDISIGIVDGTDNTGQSQITLNSPGITEPVPEPITILGSIMALGCGATLRRRFARERE